MTNEWVTSSTLLLGLREFTNQEAWNRFTGRFQEPLVRFARRIGLTEAEAEDCAQETLLDFAEALRRGKYEREKGRLSSWLFGIAYRKALNLRRRRRRNGNDQQVSADTAFWASLPDEQEATRCFDEEWQRSLLNRCLARVQSEVNEQTYAAFALTVCEGQTADQAADQLGMSRAAVYTAKHRVLKRVRQLQTDLELIAL